MTRSQTRTRKPSQPSQPSQPASQAADPNYREIAYSHYRIRWSSSHWSLYLVSSGKWERLDAGRNADRPNTVRGVIAMCDAHLSGKPAAELYAAAQAASPSRKLRAVDSQPAAEARAPSRGRSRSRKAEQKPAATQPESRPAADDYPAADEQAETMINPFTGESVPQPASGKPARKAAAAPQPDTSTTDDRTAATLKALDVALAAVHAAQSLLSR
jgi:hypothetical protein